MNFTKQNVIDKLSKLISFLDPVFDLANSHFASFFTDDLWAQHIPSNIQSELNSLKSINEFIQLYPQIIKSKCPSEFATRHPNLISFVHTIMSISVMNDRKIVKTVADLEILFSSLGCSTFRDFKLEECMTQKKLHEVKVTSKITAALSSLTKSSHIVDVGGGKGYLSSILALSYSFKVLGLDSSQVTTCGAIKRSERIAKLWDDDIFKNVDPGSCKNVEKTWNKKVKEEFIKEHYKQVTTFVTSDTNVSKILKENFSEDVEGITLTGLHTCGNLSPTCLEMFLNNKDIRGLINVGCCYHLIDEETCVGDFWKDVGTEKPEYCGFPLSDFLKKRNYILGRNARMLACHSLDRMDSNLEMEDFSQTSLLYRAILETVIRKRRGYASKQEQVGRLAKKCKNFQEYMLKALKKLDINMLVTESDLDELYERYHDKKHILTAFYLFRVLLAPIIESIILLDRLLYLIENGVSNAYLVRLFDLKVSPRGFGVIAWKNSNES